MSKTAPEHALTGGLRPANGRHASHGGVEAQRPKRNLHNKRNRQGERMRRIVRPRTEDDLRQPTSLCYTVTNGLRPECGAAERADFSRLPLLKTAPVDWGENANDRRTASDAPQATAQGLCAGLPWSGLSKHPPFTGDPAPDAPDASAAETLNRRQCGK